MPYYKTEGKIENFFIAKTVSKRNAEYILGQVAVLLFVIIIFVYLLLYFPFLDHSSVYIYIYTIVFS